MTTPPDINQALAEARSLRDAGRTADAIAAVATILQAEPDHVAALRLHGALALRAGNHQAAVDALTHASALAPTNADILLERGNALLTNRRPEQAATVFQHALALRPRDAAAFRGLAQSQLALSQPTEALENFRKALAILPYDNYAAHMVAALSGETSRGAQAYVADLFDEYADTFDEHLTGTLEYRVPQALHDLLSPHLPRATLLDLGCGTGLVGAQLHHLVPVMDGVDISREMTAKAEHRGIYRHLRTGDLVTTMTTDMALAGPYDLITAGDVLGYLGPLETTFAAVRQRLASEGLFAFSVETIDGTAPFIRASGRFAHPDAYILALAAEHGFAVIEQRATILRQERDQPIAGMLYLLKAT